MPSDTICVCNILNDFVTDEADAYSPNESHKVSRTR